MIRRAAPIALLTLTSTALAQDVRVRVSAENLAPRQATFQTPVWVGFHDGGFDLYDRDQPADFLLPAPVLEGLAEDGATGPLADAFVRAGRGSAEATLFGPAGVIAPGEQASAQFLLDPWDVRSRYLSYATMVVPSNDAFLANGDPRALRIFSDEGRFLGPSHFAGPVLDAGTEVNDEVPANTAFFGQSMPNTGVDENGLVRVHPGFLPVGSGGILDDFRFQEATITEAGYPSMKLRVEAAPAVSEFEIFLSVLSGSLVLPPVDTPAFGAGLVVLDDEGQTLKYFFKFFHLQNVVAARLHLGEAGENGPVVSSLVEGATPGGGPFRLLFGEIGFDDLVGPFEAAPLDALSAALQREGIHVTVATDDGRPGDDTGPGDFVSGELRGPVLRTR